MTRITLPWPPSTNRYWRYVGGRVLISAHGRQYRQDVARITTLVRADGQVPRGPIADRVGITIMASPPDRIRRDLDNLLKGLLDALTHAGIWLDDSQVDDLHITRCAPSKPGNVIILIRSLSQEEAA